MTIRQLTALELREALAARPEMVLLDVREPSEFRHARIDGSVLIPLRELPGRLDELDTGAETVAICHHGVRSMQAARLLLAAGFGRVANLWGGIDAWSLQCDPSVPRY